MRPSVQRTFAAVLTAAPSFVRARAAMSCVVVVLSVLATAHDAAAQLPDTSSHAGAPMVLAGAGPGSGFASAIAATDGAQIFGGQVFAGFTGGVRVATGDVNGDGIDDLIVATGPGAGFVRVFSGRDLSTLAFFAPFGGGFSGGVYVAAGDIDGDGRADIVVGSGSGGLVSAYSGADLHLIGQATPFGGGYQGGVTVAVGDVDGDGRSDVLVGMASGGLVTALSGVDAHVIASGFPYGPLFSGGVNLATGDVNGDGRVDIITAPASGGTLVQAFSGVDLAVLASYSPYPGGSGVTVAAADIDGDGRADIITGPTSGPPLVRVFSVAGQHEISSFLAFDAGFGGGVFVASDSRFAVVSAPIFVNGTQASWTAGNFSAFAITTRGVPAGATISLSGALPAGLSFFSGFGTAVISGTPTTPGSTTVTLTATNAIGSTTQVLAISIGQGSSGGSGGSGGSTGVAPAFGSSANATFVIGTSGLFTVTTSGTPTATVTRAGALPLGVAFTDLGDGTATISGTAAANTNGTYPLTITATNTAGSTVQNFVLTVNNSATPTITSAASATFTVNAFATFTVTTTASPAVTSITSTGGLPAGVTFVYNGNGTATLSGTPLFGTNGTYPITFTASNGTPATQNFTLTVNPASGGAPTITSANAATFVVGSAGIFSITTTGAPTASSITETGALPPGITFTNNGDGTATIAGTPAAGSAGTYPLTITAANGVLPDAVQSFTLTVNNVTSAPTFTSAASTTFTVGAAGTFSITTSASPAVTSITEVGGLPAGVTFSDNGNGTATLAGTPGAGSAGAHPLTLTATNGGAPVTQNFTLIVQQTAAITSANSATFTTGAPGSFAITANGTPTPSLARTGALPTGVTFTDNGDGTATLSGTPAAGAGGTYPLTITATNGVGAAATQSFTLTVNDAGAFTSANSTTFTVGQLGTFSITTSSFPIATNITETGALPSGVMFTSNGNGTATLSGTPAGGTAGAYPLTFTFNNGGGPVTQNFTLNVQQAPLFTSGNSTTVTVGTAVNFGVTASGFPAPTITQTGGALPTGLNFSGTALVGTPTQFGSFSPQFTAANGIVPDAVQNFALTVSCPAITVSPGLLPNGLYNTLYAPVTFTAVGSTGSSFTWTAPALPAGLTIGSTTGIVSGTPTTTVSAQVVTITATDNFGCVGSVSTTITVRPVAGNDSFTAIGNTQLAVGATGAVITTPVATTPAGNVKANDSGPGTLTVGFAGASANGGTIAGGTADGSFVYTPPPNFGGASDSFTYTLTDGNGVTNSAIVTINFQNRIWYVNNSGANGDGRSNSPFNNLNNAQTPSVLGDIIYVHTGAGTTPGSLAMDASSTLQGAGGAVLLTGGSPTTTLSIPAGTPPTLSGTVTLASNTAIKNVNFSGASPAMTASGLATTVPSVIDGVSVSGGTNALSLTNVTATGTGAINVTNSSFTNTSAAEVLVNGGNVPLAIGATISSNAGRSIDIQNRTGGTVTFSGSITDTAQGVFLNANTGSTINFTGGLSLTTGANPGFTATGGGTVSATQDNTTIVNTITTTTGTALNVVNTSIGASGLTFRSINSTTASANSGIVLNTTGGSGGLIVTGIGTTAGSGGTISNKTAATGGISLTSTSGVSLSNMIVQSNSFEGIVGTSVNGFSLTGSSVTGNSNATNNRNGILLTDTTGAVSFVNDTVTGNQNFNAQLTASGTSTAAITTLTVTGGSYSSSVQNGGFLVDLRNTATLGAAWFNGVTFSGNFSKGLQLQTSNNSVMGNSTQAPLPAWSPAPPNGSVTVIGNTFTNNNVAASFESGGGTGGTGSVYYRFVNNLTITGSQSHAVNFANGSDSGGGTYKAFVSGNVIGNAGVAASGSVTGNGMRFFMQGQQAAILTIQNNTIRQAPIGRGIEVAELGRPGAGFGQTALDVRITGNDVNPQDSTGFPLYAIYVGADAQGTGTSGSNVRAEIHGNTVPTPANGACDTQCGATVGMIVYETVSGATGTTSGTLFQTGAGGSVSNEIATTNTGTAGKTCSFVNGGTLTLSGTPPATVARLSMPHLVPAAAMAHSVFAAGRSDAPALPPVAFIAIPMRRWSARGVTITKEGPDG